MYVMYVAFICLCMYHIKNMYKFAIDNYIAEHFILIVNISMEVIIL